MHAIVIVGEAQNIFPISDLRQTDKLFLLVSALCVAHDSVFKETTLKRSVCLLLSRSIRQDDQGCCQELFGDDAQPLCRCLLSQHIHQGGATVLRMEQHAVVWRIWCYNIKSWAVIGHNHSSSLSRIIMTLWYDIMTLRYTILLSEMMIPSKTINILFWQNKVWKILFVNSFAFE